MPEMELVLAPRAKPYQRWLPEGEMPQPLSLAGEGTLPSAVMPYQILFIT